MIEDDQALQESLQLARENQFKEADEKFIQGDGISDEELQLLLEFYRPLAAKLKLLGPHFHLAWRECLSRTVTLIGFARSRAERK